MAAVVVALVMASGAGAAARYTKPQAYKIIAHCLTRAGARSVKRTSSGGRANFRGFYKFVSWSYTTSGQSVLAVNYVYTVSAKTKRRANVCLKPYGWRV